MEFVVKVHSRCNLNCDYCYVYEMADQSWADQPKIMSHSTMASVSRRIAEHAEQFSLPRVRVVLHGGEPLLAGHAELVAFLAELRGAVGSGTRLDLGVQTNGVLLDEEFLEIFDQWNVRVGVSLDGSREATDRHRRYRDGRSSYDAVVKGLRRLTEGRYKHLFSGLLCTIDVANDPIRTYEELISLDPPAVDFLLPHGNWTNPPPLRVPDQTLTPYADWLCSIFDHWYAAPHRTAGIRFFDQIINLLLGGESRSEAIGLSALRTAVFETDGTLEQIDTLKSTYAGASKLGTARADYSLADALWHPGNVSRQLGTESLSSSCLDCPVHRICGGGLFAHRYREDSGFTNPSVYCADLKRIIEHVRSRIHDDLAQ